MYIDISRRRTPRMPKWKVLSVPFGRKLDPSAIPCKLNIYVSLLVTYTNISPETLQVI